MRLILKFNTLYNLRIATNFWRKDQTYVKDGCQSYDCFKGIKPEIFAYTQLKLNFTFTLKVDDVPVTGQELESGYWSGMIGILKILIIYILLIVQRAIDGNENLLTSSYKN